MNSKASVAAPLIACATLVMLAACKPAEAPPAEEIRPVRTITIGKRVVRLGRHCRIHGPEAAGCCDDNRTMTSTPVLDARLLRVLVALASASVLSL